MVFSELVNILHALCNDGSEPAEYIKTLIDHFMVDPLNCSDATKSMADEYNPLVRLGYSARKSIANGNRKIAKKSARYILSRMDKEKFADFILTYSDDVLEAVRGKLELAVGESIDLWNVGSVCASVFEDILTELAKVNKHPKTKSDQNAIRASDLSTTRHQFYQRQKDSFLNSSALPWLSAHGVSRDFMIPSLMVSTKVHLAKHPKKSHFTEILKTHDWQSNTLILGAPGAGKSTFLYCIYVRLIEIIGDEALVFFMNAREFEGSKDTDQLSTLLNEYLAKRDVPNDLLNQGKFIVLIDGLDEVSDIASDRLFELMERSSQMYTFVLTCREQIYNLRAASNKHYDIAFSEAIIIEPWDETIADEFAENYFYAINESEKHKDYQELLRINNTLLAFHTNPFQINILIYIFLDAPEVIGKSEKINVYSLYEKFVGVLWKSEKKRHTDNLKLPDFKSKCTQIAGVLYDNQQSGVDGEIDDILANLADSALLSMVTYDEFGGSAKFRHESFFDFFVARRFVDILRFGSCLELLKEFRNFYNFYINQFVRDGISYYQKELQQYYSKFAAIYFSCYNGTSEQALLRGYIGNVREDDLCVVSKLSTNLDVNFIERELSIYYIGRLGLKRFPEILLFAYHFEPSQIMKRTAAIGAMLYRKEEIEFEYVDTLIPGSPADIRHRSITLLYFEDSYGSIFDYDDDNKIAWKRSKEAIINRLAIDSDRNLCFRLWDIRTLRLFCLSRKSCSQLTSRDIDVIANLDTTSDCYSKEKAHRIGKEKRELMELIINMEVTYEESSSLT